MPCRCDGYQDPRDEQEKRMKAELDLVTRLLCFVMSTFDDDSLTSDYEIVNKILNEKDLILWWGEHQEKDRLRLEKEREEQEKKNDYAKQKIEILENQIKLLKSQIK